ncbi:hypothetical protein MRQ36_29640 [Micromonospora sp. R77]|uniref:hypothetical protein n=1 Tax=Micromonospora sp. R77 TaxID=2925836 RepID=UPI001F611824|nr:hypothetical protein [Micromonospora sp. R77]MCI4066496.1 hypothetical protein [Micromonospora sp. R77]
MSVQEHIFIRTDLSPEEAARQIASVLAMDFSRGKAAAIFLSRPAHADQNKQIGGEVAENYLADPAATGDEASLLDDYEIIWDLGYTGRERTVQLAEARLLFTELASAALWPAALVAGLDVLVAAWDPSMGLTWFPPRTSPDADQRDAWQRYGRAIQSR